MEVFWRGSHPLVCNHRSRKRRMTPFPHAPRLRLTLLVTAISSSLNVSKAIRAYPSGAAGPVARQGGPALSTDTNLLLKKSRILIADCKTTILRSKAAVRRSRLRVAQRFCRAKITISSPHALMRPFAN